MVRTILVFLSLWGAAAGAAWGQDVHQLPVRIQDDAQPMDGQDKPKTIDEKFEEFRKALPFDIHGGAYLWHYLPLDIAGAKADTSLYYAWLSFSAQFDDFGFYFEPHFRDTPLRPFFTSNFWVQEIYASWKVPYGIGTLKAGKEYDRTGRFWDGSFYGNLPYFDGLKLDPDLGFSLENNATVSKELSVEYSAQYFMNDGRTNGSLVDSGLTQPRDTIGDKVSRQRNIFAIRVAPTYKISDNVAVTLGVSAQHFRADFPTAAAPDDQVGRETFEAALAIGPATLFAEYTIQSGHHVLNYPVAGVVSDHNRYIMAGATYTWDILTFRYDYSLADYHTDTRIRETFQMPAVVAAVHKHLSLWMEFVYWRQDLPAAHDIFMDRSLNFVLDLHF